MTVRIEKPAINVREELADLRKPTGIAGEAMLRAETPQEQFNLIGAGRRNLIINGAMQVAQRGTSKTDIGYNAGGPFICDRFQHVQGSGGGSGVMTMEQSTDAPDGFSYSTKFTVTTADTLSGGENIGFRYRLEAGDCQALKFGTSGNKFTISFWVKSSISGIYSLQCFGSDTSRSALSSYTVNVANTWEYKTLTFNVDPTTAIATGTGRGLGVIWMLDSGPDDIQSAFDWSTVSAFSAVTGQVNFMTTSGATWQITGVQLELGKVATPFEHRSYGEELALCQRYYEKQTFTGGYQFVCNSLNTTTTQVEGFIPFMVEKRVSPTVTSSAASTWRVNALANDATASAISWFTGTKYGVRGNWTRSSGSHVLREASYVNVENASPFEAYISIDAEL